MNKKYAIFDMDGTLIDSMKYWRNLIKEYLESKGVSLDIGELMVRIKSMTIAQSTQYLSGLYPVLGTAEEMASGVIGLMKEHYLNDVTLKDGIVEYLEKLKGDGVKMCIATITGRPLMTLCLKRLGIFDYFDFILTGTEVKTGKNTPEMYLLAAEKMGALPPETAVFEDTLKALTTAKNAGFYTVGIFDESEKANTDKIKELADEYIDSWRELL